MNIFQLSSRHEEWLSMRRTLTASNVSNANTPNYKSRDVVDFGTYLDRTDMRGPTAGANLDAAVADDPAAGLTLHSSNSVNLDAELLKLGDIGRSHALNTATVRSFHRMFITASK